MIPGLMSLCALSDPLVLILCLPFLVVVVVGTALLLSWKHLGDSLEVQRLQVLQCVLL